MSRAPCVRTNFHEKGKFVDCEKTNCLFENCIFRAPNFVYLFERKVVFLNSKTDASLTCGSAAMSPLQIVRERHIVERRIGMGNRSSFAGWRSNVRAAMTNTSLAAVNRRFWVSHNLSSVALLASMSGLAIHLWYLANKLSL